MKKSRLLIFFLIFTYSIFGQTSDNSLRMISNYGSENSEIRDILQFEGIDYYKIKFIGTNLSEKSYHLSVKEIWDGKIVSDTTIINSKESLFQQYRKVNDTVLELAVIAKYTKDKSLKMTFKFSKFFIEREFKAIESEDYSLRNIAEESSLNIEYNKNFYLLAYILPYEREDGSKSWCDVGIDGADIENWGEKFGIKHYLLFEMKFE